MWQAFVFLIVSAQDGLALSDIILKTESGLEGGRIEFQSQIPIPEEHFYIYPGIAPLIQAFEANPSQSIRVEVMRSDGSLQNISGTRESILQELQEQMKDRNINTLRVVGHTLRFSREEAATSPERVQVAVEGGRTLVQTLLIGDAIGRARVIPRLWNAGRRATRRAFCKNTLAELAKAPAPRPTPSARIWPFELAAAGLLHFPKRNIADTMTRERALESLAEDVKALEENRAAGPTPMTDALEAALAPRAILSTSKAIWLTNPAIEHLYRPAEARTLSVVLQLKAEREKNQAILDRSFYFALPSNGSDEEVKAEQALNNALNHFEIRVPVAGLREYQTFRRENGSRLKPFSEMSEDDRGIYLSAERALKEAYDLYRMREAFDTAVSQSMLDLQNLSALLRRESQISPQAPQSILALMQAEANLRQRHFPGSEMDVLKRIELAKAKNFDALASMMLSDLRQQWTQLYFSLGSGIDNNRLTQINNGEIALDPMEFDTLLKK